MNSRLADLEQAQNGILTPADARDRGVSASTILRAVRRRELHRVGRGAYVAPKVDEAPEELHRRRALAALRESPPLTALTHQSALAFWGLPVAAVDLSLPHLGRVHKPAVKKASGWVWHRLPDGTPSRTVAGITVVTPAVAVVQVAMSSPRAGLVAADALVAQTDHQARPRIMRDIDAAIRLYTRCSGISVARRTLSLIDRGAESPGESLLRHDVRMLGYDVHTQFRIDLGNGRYYRADMRIRDTDILLGYDGEAKYSDPDPRRQADIRRSERTREQDLRRLGWRIARFTRHDLQRYDAIRTRITEAA